MIYDTLVWTKRGWQRAENLIIGDVIISYNSSRDCTEYDSVTYIHTEYRSRSIMGLKTHSMDLAVTEDHPFLIIRSSLDKTLVRKAMNDVFLNITKTQNILYTSSFEPYLMAQDMDDVAWSARVASSYGHVKYMPIDLYNEVWKIAENICGIEAQHWIDIFFHWNVLMPGTYFAKATKLHNRQTRALVHHIAPRAGFGSKVTRNPRGAGQWIIGLSTQTNPEVRKTNWYRDRVEGIFFNIKTKNGNFLAKKLGGTFLCPCDIT